MSDTQTTPHMKRALPPLMSLSESAAERLRELYTNADKRLLRIAVTTKGCSGMSYNLSWVEAVGSGDEVVIDKGVTLLVDRKATLFLIGSIMDYEVKDMSAGFIFVNPNEKGRCGCGESFHI